jgi:serine phosphatase RsbU (regulator of sigma subunit)
MSSLSELRKKYFRLNIGRKIGIGFGALVTLALINFIFTYFTLQESEKISNSIVNVYNPSVDKLDELDLLIVTSKMLISNWVFIQRPDDDPDKQRLRVLINTDYPNLKKEILALTAYWEENEKDGMDTIFHEIDSLFIHHKYIMEQLNSFLAYEDALIVFDVRPMVEDGEVSNETTYILGKIDQMAGLQHEKTKEVTDNMVSSFNRLQISVQSSGFILIVGGLIIALLTITTIVKPIHGLKGILLEMAKGILPTEHIADREDEIGEMSNALNLLVDGMKRTTAFAHETGAGNFDADYQPLSDQDNLGLALLRMRNDLAENERLLEQKVVERTEEVVRQKEQIAHLYEAVTDSIKYAKRIQNSILPPDHLVKKHLPESFILYKPKDIVSGDFYWMEHHKGKTFVAAVDCTGHGVPGALMSIVGFNIIAQSVNEHSVGNASEIIDELNMNVSKMLRQGDEGKNSKDGMDVALCIFDHANRKLQYAGAYNPLYIIRGDEIIEIKADKFPIGYYIEDPTRKYTNHVIDIQDGDIFYIFSDGYCDQFGGPNGKKYMYKQFREVLLSLKNTPIEDQRIVLDNNIEKWRGDIEQLDDILVIGFRC